jgi:hypothetical protein
MRRSSVHLLCVSQRHSGWNQKSQIWTDFQQSIVHCSCFLAQSNLFILLVSFSSGFIAAICPWGPDSRSLHWTVDVCYLNSVTHLFGLQFLRLVTLMNQSSAAEVTLGLPFLWQSPGEFFCKCITMEIWLLHKYSDPLLSTLLKQWLQPTFFLVMFHRRDGARSPPVSWHLGLSVQSCFHLTRESCFSWSESPLSAFWQTPSGLSMCLLLRSGFRLATLP